MAEVSGARGMLDFHEMMNALLNLQQGEQILVPLDGETGSEETRRDSILWAAPIRVQPPRRRLGPQYQGMIGRRTVNAVLTLPGEQLLVPVDGNMGPEKADKRMRNARTSAKSRRNRGKNAIIHEKLQQANRKLREIYEVIREQDEVIREQDEMLRQQAEEYKQLRQQRENKGPQN
ncbi:hypothetical protein E4U09_004254 [Claviceps aff. purpurea]|uniref:Uncharacterized protein n=1 Tax=Claviceps aff. purpurea TaxID=1967640 RepID=A0A9P7U925_9HYPO|nr:hypothetical protein E4U09_004254 [Claviceps aff. purpurea]